MNTRSLHLCFVGNMLGKHPQYSNTQGEILAGLLAAEGYRITCVSAKINRLARLLEIVLTLVRKRKQFDLVMLEVYSGLYFIIAHLAGSLCRAFNIPLIMVLHGGELPGFAERFPRWTRNVFFKADLMVAPSQFMADRIGTLGFPIRVISNVVDLAPYTYRERGRIEPNLIWMRSFHPIYNPEMAVRVLARVRERYPDARLVMAGADKGLEKQIKSLAAENGLAKHIRFAGFLDLNQKLKEFSEADIYLNTNRIDNMPVSVVEARALGLPVVATRVGGLPYMVRHMEDGILVPSEDDEGMAHCVMTLVDDPVLTQKLSRNGRLAAELSGWKAVRAKWENSISSVIAKYPAPRDQPARIRAVPGK